MIKAKQNAYDTKSNTYYLKKFWNGLLDNGFVVSKVDPCMFIFNTVIFVVYVDNYLFWSRSQSDIHNIMKYFKEDCPSYNWEHSNW